MFCKNCGKEIDDKAAICVHCGVATGYSDKKDNEWFTVLMMCLFLGAFGVHRFYTGYKKEGVAQLALIILGLPIVIPTIIGGIWVLMDFINILCGNFKTKDGKNLVK